jgi:argininosuccinate lyase
LAALRLYSKAQVIETKKAANSLIGALKKLAAKNKSGKMPGYTHLQRAMPSSVSLWANAFADSLADDLLLLDFSAKLVDQNPLGSAAGYGVPIKIDRMLTTKLLGFSKLQENPLYCANSRGKFESILLSALVQLMLDVNKIATDLLLFSTKEFGFFELPEKFCTGSSIMPQKKNPDVLELCRAKNAIVQAELFKTLSIISSLPSGYNRDFQLTKEPLINGFETTIACLKILSLVIAGLKVNKKACAVAMTPELFATENALKKVVSGIPFRDAYKQAAAELTEKN